MFIVVFCFKVQWTVQHSMLNMFNYVYFGAPEKQERVDWWYVIEYLKFENICLSMNLMENLILKMFHQESTL
jgi:hypothetical protein